MDAYDIYNGLQPWMEQIGEAALVGAAVDGITSFGRAGFRAFAR